jgi:hypothetical protein
MADEEKAEVVEELSTQDVLAQELEKMTGETIDQAPTFEEAQVAQAEDVETSKIEEEEKPQVEEKELSEPSEELSITTELSEEDNEFIGNLKPKAQERFKHWIDRANEAESKLEESKTAGQVFENISNSTTNPDQLNWALDVFKSLNSGDYDSARDALKSMDKFTDQVAQKLGLNSSVNEDGTFKDFEDLSKAVEDLDMSEDWANKLASDRLSTNSRLQARSEFNKGLVESQEQQAWYNNESNKAYQAIQEWEKEIVDTDPDYSIKKEIMMDVGAKIANSNIAPSKWLEQLKSEYDILSRGITAAASKIPKASKGSGPLAPSGNSGSHSGSGFLESAEVTPEFLQAHLDRMHS